MPAFKEAFTITYEIMTIDEVAAYVKLSKKTIYRLLIEDRFPGFKLGGSWRFEVKQVNKWIDNQKSNLARK